jgi:hypothetical protein
MGMWDSENISDEEIDPYVWFSNLSAEPYPAFKWQGEVIIPDDRQYRIWANCNGYVRIEIDNKQYWDAGLGGDYAEKIKKFFKNDKAVRADRFNLKKGKHKIEIYSYTSNMIDLLWDAGDPSSGGTFLPPDILEPDYQITGNK